MFCHCPYYQSSIILKPKFVPFLPLLHFSTLSGSHSNQVLKTKKPFVNFCWPEASSPYATFNNCKMSLWFDRTMIKLAANDLFFFISVPVPLHHTSFRTNPSPPQLWFPQLARLHLPASQLHHSLSLRAVLPEGLSQ